VTVSMCEAHVCMAVHVCVCVCVCVQLLFIRHQFKIAFFNELKQDPHTAVKYVHIYIFFHPPAC